MKKTIASAALTALCILFALTAFAADITLSVGQNLSLIDKLPIGVTFISASSSNTSCVTVSGSNASAVSVGTAVLNVLYGIFDAGTGQTIYSGSLTFSVEVTGGGGGGGGGGSGSASYNVSLKAGESATAATGFSWISGFASTNSSVAEAYQDGEALKVRAHNTGSCTLTCQGYRIGESSSTNLTIYATVSASSNSYNEGMTIYVGENRSSSRRFSRINTLFSSNPTVASVMDNGGIITVYGYKAGFATVSASALDFDGSTVDITFVVTVMTTSGSVITQSDYVENVIVPVGKTGYVESAFSGVTNLTSADPTIAVARYSQGRIWITGRADGNTTVTASAVSVNTPVLIKINVTVGTGGGSTGRTGSGSSKKAAVGEVLSENIFVKVGKSGYSTAPVYDVYSVSVADPYVCEAVITTNGIKVTGLSAGRTTVNAAAYDNDGRRVTLRAFITVSPSKTASGSGSSGTVQASSASNVRVTEGSSKLVETKYTGLKSIRSSDDSVADASLEDGLIRITGISAGAAEIVFQAKTSPGSAYKTYVFDVTVTGGSDGSYQRAEVSEAEFDEGDGSGLTINASQPLTAGKNQTYTFPTVYVNGERMPVSKLLFSTSDSSVLTVSRRGRYSTYSGGSAEIIVATRDGRYKQSFAVDVE